MKKLIILSYLILGNLHLIFSQNENPVWDIGTKWTYELIPEYHYYSYLTNEIVDTVTIDSLKLFAVESYPVYSGIQYFHYKNDQVYNYDTGTKILQLLYDFNNEKNYNTKYRPICDPYFDYDNMQYKVYGINIDSLAQYQMSDGSFRTIQYVTTIDTIFEDNDTSFFKDQDRSIIDGIGFLRGGIHYTHDWEFGVHICDEFANFVSKLRCFETGKGQVYKFVEYPCDTTWITTSTKDLADESDILVYPNPTNDFVKIFNLKGPCKYEIYNLKGTKINTGQVSNKSNITITLPGLQILKLYTVDKIITRKILKLE